MIRTVLEHVDTVLSITVSMLVIWQFCMNGAL